jgi:release factor glutamine methyltransferase|tara:strand:+ start:2972 stop:3802 length:831 start_codon:yes stop_codon:yes gene_type:complete
VTIWQLLQRSAELTASDSAVLDTELLLSHALGVNRTYFRTWPDRQPNSDQLKTFGLLFQRRLQGEPIAYILGHQGFWSLDLNVSEHTLIPRPETELLVETALELTLPRHSSVLDLGTGTGAIALALASERRNWNITAVDVQPQAVALAEVNRAAHKLDNVQIMQSNWFTALPSANFDLIVSNPPYIENNDPHLRQGDVRFEPASALVSGADGLDDLILVIGQSAAFLTPSGWLLVEHGYDQGAGVRALFAEVGFSSIETRRDYNQIERVTFGQLSQ